MREWAFPVRDTLRFGSESPDHVEKFRTVTFQFDLSDAVDLQHIVFCAWLVAAHLDQRCVTENHIRWNALSVREALAQFA